MIVLEKSWIGQIANFRFCSCFEGIPHEKIATSKCSPLYGCCDFTWASLYCFRVPSTVVTDFPCEHWYFNQFESLFLSLSHISISFSFCFTYMILLYFFFITNPSKLPFYVFLWVVTNLSIYLLISVQWKFVPTIAEEHIQARLETACSYGFGYSKCCSPVCTSKSWSHYKIVHSLFLLQRPCIHFHLFIKYSSSTCGAI